MRHLEQFGAAYSAGFRLDRSDRWQGGLQSTQFALRRALKLGWKWPSEREPEGLGCLTWCKKLLYYQTFAHWLFRGTEHVYKVFDSGRVGRPGQMVRDRCRGPSSWTRRDKSGNHFDWET